MTNITGIGGVFFRSRDAAALKKWYQDVLGFDFLGGVWTQESGPTILAPFSQDTDYFGARDRQWMINFRVRDLDVLLEKIRAQGVDVITKPEWDSEIGRFARIHDPEGNPIELWQPGDDSQ